MKKKAKPSVVSNGIRVAVVAPSGCAGKIEIKLGTERLRQAGFDVRVHKQSYAKDRYLAGSDLVRAQAFLDVAMDPEVDVVWCVRGGYGAIRTMEVVDELLKSKNQARPSPKLLVGYSDVTVLLEYVRTRWNWKALHGSMVGVGETVQIPQKEWSRLTQLVERIVRGKKCELEYTGLKSVVTPASQTTSVQAAVVGGNLSVWVSMLGTGYTPKAEGCILFLEEIDESQYRIDRLLTQLRQAGGLKGVKAIVTGTFTRCKDMTLSVLSAAPKKVEYGKPLPDKLKREPLRKVASDEAGVLNLYRELGEKLQIPVVMGLPVGHGGGYGPLYLGQTYELKFGSGKTRASLELR